MDFTVYLRKNFTSIASTDPIPFSSELEHTRAYLAVELEMMCSGSMTISAHEGSGTVVTVTIPDSSEREKGLEEL